MSDGGETLLDKSNLVMEKTEQEASVPSLFSLFNLVKKVFTGETVSEEEK